METIDIRPTTTAQPGPFSLLTCLCSLPGLVLLFYVMANRPMFGPPGWQLSPRWNIGFFAGGCLVMVGLLFCALAVWRKERETHFKTFGLFLNFVVMFLLVATIIFLSAPEQNLL